MRGQVQRLVAALLIAIFIAVMTAAHACAAACAFEHQAGSMQTAAAHADMADTDLPAQPPHKSNCLGKGVACHLAATAALQSAAIVAAPEEPLLPRSIGAAVFRSMTHAPPERPPMTLF